MSIIEQSAVFANPVLQMPIIRRIRRNHAFEHATIHILNRHRIRLSGHSNANGFVLFGDVSTEAVQSAASEALKRLQNGESNLAVHPNCGTNLMTAGFLTTLVGLVGFSGRSKRAVLDRFSWVMFWMMLAIIVSRPLGMALQRHYTTESNPGDMELVNIRRHTIELPIGRTLVIHTVQTTNG